MGQQIHGLYAAMAGAGIVAEASTFTAVVRALLTAGMVVEANAVVVAMVQAGVPATNDMLDIVSGKSPSVGAQKISRQTVQMLLDAKRRSAKEPPADCGPNSAQSIANDGVHDDECDMQTAQSMLAGIGI